MTTMTAEPVVAREGLSLRTEQELVLLFMSDVRDIAHREDPNDYVDATEIEFEGLRAYRLKDPGLLFEMGDEAAMLLYQMSYVSEWPGDGGYQIYREA